MTDRYLLHCEGNVSFCTDGVPDELFGRSNGDTGFMYCWNDGSWGVGTELGANGAPGGFLMTVEVGQGDSELLKLQASSRMQERVSGNVRTFAVGTGGVPLDSLLGGKECTFALVSPYNEGNFAQGTMRAINAHEFANGLAGSQAADKPRIQLKQTALRHLPAYNEALNTISSAVQENMACNKIGMPPGGEMFRTGISSWQFGGAVLSDGTKLPNFGAHYSLMGEQELHVDRRLPVGLGVYGIYLRMQHSGLTMRQILALPVHRKCHLFFSGCGLNFDAELLTYCSDVAKGIQMSPLTGIGIGQRGSEDWVSARAQAPACPEADASPCLQCLPGSAAANQGRVLLAPNPIVPEASMTMKALGELASGRAENRRHCLTDDCESLGYWQLTMMHSMQLSMRDSPDLRAQCAGFQCLFAAWTPRDWSAMTSFVREMTGLLDSGALSMTTVTGIATNAAAGDVGGDSYNGHCHNLARLDVPGEPLHCFIVEGTAPMEVYTVTKDSPTVTCKVMNDQQQFVEEVLCRTDFLTRLGKSVSAATMFINQAHGAGESSAGWPRAEPMTGWVGSTVFTNGLDSDPSFPLKFYNRFMYTGLKCTAGGAGCLPVQEARVGLTAGCHPYDMNRMDLRAVDVPLPPGLKQTMRDIMNEANPPVSAPDFWQKLASTWVPACPLLQINRGVQETLAPGVAYTVVSCMESPASQDYIPVLHEVKRRLAERASAINAAAPGSDGIHVTAEMLGTGVSLKLFVPDRPIHGLTVMQSLIQAMHDVGWQGHIPDPHGG